MLVDHECILKLLKLETTRKLAVRHTNFVCLTASFLATGGFIKLLFTKFHDFFMHGTFFHDFQVFHDFQISMKVWDLPWIELTIPGSAIRLATDWTPLYYMYLDVMCALCVIMRR